MKSGGLKIGVLAIVFSLFLIADMALADGWPASVAGTWTVIGANAEGTLTITQSSGTSTSTSKPIRGFIYNTDNIEGFYNPSSGRIAFIRFDRKTYVAKQFWSGNLTQSVTGKVLRIGGTLTVFRHNNITGTIGGSLGEYNFSAIKK